ncbi:MAG: hypothetical protein IT207_01090 [Fimbriimonadaceae bacterium]|nr:hypothetical protein [Fimbriimonadaceae bacterium]
MKLKSTLVGFALLAVGANSFAQTIEATAPPKTPDDSWMSVKWGPDDGTPTTKAIAWGSASPRDPIVHTPGPTFSPNAHGKIPGEIVPLDPNNQAKVHLDLESPQTAPLVGEFEGIPQTTLTPPDPCMAVGPDHYILTVNDRWAIYDKCGNQLFNSRIGDFVSDPSGFYFDPKVFYDPWRFRWGMLWHRGTGNPSNLVTFGTTSSDPMGQWVWKYWSGDGIFGAGTFSDYYDWGYSAQALYASGNQFGGAGFRTGMWIFNPAEIYAAGGATAAVYNIATNDDGTGADTIRSTHMLYSFGGGWDMVCFNSRSGGGNRMYIQKVQDPLNVGAGRLRTASHINVASYSVPPDATHNGGSLDTIDCRSYNGQIIDGVAGQTTSMTLLTSLNTADAAFGGRCSSKMMALDPTASTVGTDVNFTDGVHHYWFGAPSANYQDTGVFWFSRSIAGEFVTMRYVAWSGAGLSGSAHVEAGTGNASGRWGDYFQGTLDWADYYAYGGTAGPQKHWGYAEISGAGGWRTRVGITTADVTTAGVMTVAPGTNMAFTGFVGGPFTPANEVYTLGNTGQVGYGYEVSSLPSWLSATNGSGQVFGTNVNVSIFPDATANGLGYGIYTDASILFTNCYSLASTSRSATLTVKARIVPTSVTVRLGRIDAGNVVSLRADDANYLRVCKFIVPNSIVPPVNVEVSTTAPGATASQIVYEQLARMFHAGSFNQQLELWNYNTGNWGATTSGALGTVFVNRTVTVNAGANNYIGPANAMLARYRISQTGPAAVSAWCHEVDYVNWELTP